MKRKTFRQNTFLRRPVEICRKLIPIRKSKILVVKLLSLLAFTFVVFVVIMETPHASDRAKLRGFSIEDFGKKVRSTVDEYLTNADKRYNSNDTVLENEMSVLVINELFPLKREKIVCL